MRKLSTFADKLVGAFVPKAVAHATTCRWVACGPRGEGLRYCCWTNGVQSCGGCNLP